MVSICVQDVRDSASTGSNRLRSPSWVIMAR